MPVGGWSLDHLYVDQFGVLTLVETKLMQNPESRRQVIGQIIEYAANSKDQWASGRARQFASAYYSERGKNLDEELESFFGSAFDEEGFWDRIENNLRTGNFRLMIAADKLRPEVIKMIEYLNDEMRNADVLGLELRCYGSGDDEYVLTPRVVGQSLTVADRKQSAKQRVLWSEPLLREWLAQIENEKTANRWKILLDLAINNKIFAESTSQNPAFGILGKSGQRAVYAEQTGRVYFVLKADRYPGDKAMPEHILRSLQESNLLDPSLSIEDISDGRSTIRSFEEMDDAQFQVVIRLVKECVL